MYTRKIIFLGGIIFYFLLPVQVIQHLTLSSLELQLCLYKRPMEVQFLTLALICHLHRMVAYSLGKHLPTPIE